MKFGAMWGVRIVNSLSEFNDGNGITCTGGCMESFWTNVYLYGNALNGLNISGATSSKNLQITNLRAEANGQYGISANGSGHLIANIVLLENTGGGMNLTASDSILNAAYVGSATKRTYGVAVSGSGNMLRGVTAINTATSADIAILDVTLPDGDGAEWVRLARKKGRLGFPSSR
jgi:CheY-like chemotaxis protein